MHTYSKQDLRERILTLLRNQKEEERLAKSLAICAKLFQIREFKEAKTILFYASFDGEVDTFTMINQAKQSGKTIALPKVNKTEKTMTLLRIDDAERDLNAGAYGIKEPNDDQKRRLDKNNIDLAVVPGVAFDKNNNRLGRGGGYYDRFLQTLPKDTPTVGLAFDFQLVDQIPDLEDHDIPVSFVVSNS